MMGIKEYTCRDENWVSCEIVESLYYVTYITNIMLYVNCIGIQIKNVRIARRPSLPRHG